MKKKLDKNTKNISLVKDSKKKISLNDNLYWFLPALLILFVMSIRLRLSDLPLERDEGEYAYFGQLILKGIPPFQIAYNMKFPGTYYFYALQMAIFGESNIGIHVGLMMVNCATIVLLFILIKNILNSKSAFFGAASYSLISLSPTVLGFAAHATNYVALWGVMGTIVLYKTMQTNKIWGYFWAGFLLGMAYVMKQSGVFFVIFGGVVIILDIILKNDRNRLKKFIPNISVYFIGGILPFLLLLLTMKGLGVFDKFWFWTIKYASAYGSRITISKGLEYFQNSFKPIFYDSIFLWLFALLGTFLLIFNTQNKSKSIFIFLFIVFSFLTTCPGFYFRQHYFITFLPSVGLAVAFFLNFLDEKLSVKFSKNSKYISSGLFAITVLIGILNEKAYLFSDDPIEMSGNLYFPNPFNESIKLAKYLNANTNEKDKIVILGSEPQILFYADRLSATGYIYMYNLMEKYDNTLEMQKEMIAEVERGNPKYLVQVNIPFSWLRHNNSELYIFDWMNNYIAKNFEQVGLIDLSAPNHASYIWDDKNNNYSHKAKNYINVYKRKLANQK